MKKKLLAILLTACMLLMMMPAVVGASAEPVEIKLAVGSPTLTVNGATSTIQKPYKANGTTMVPLSVITKAFGAGLKLENNKIITLAYNQTKVVLTIGSSSVIVNGSPVALAAEPKIVNGVTMVPLRVIATAFGATLSLDGNAITIHGLKADAASTTAGTNTSGIDSDAGKTKIGDSYYGWSMNYPTDLVLSDQSDNGGISMWTSAKEDSSMFLAVDDVDQEYSRQELRDHIKEYFNDSEFVVDSTTISIGGLSFEKTVSRDRAGWYFEYHAIQVQNRIYLIGAGVKSESREDLNKYKDILASFKPSFSKNDSALKDITKIKDGYYTAVDKDYGLSIMLPENWTRNKEEPNPTFENEHGFMSFEVSSLAAGDTAQDWMKRNRAEVESSFGAEYVREVNESSIRLADGTAQVLSFEYTFDKKSWHQEHLVFLVSGAHKYEASFYYAIDDAPNGEEQYNTMIASMDIDTAFVEKNFNELDDAEALDQMTVTKTSKKYGYSIKLPESWHGEKKDFEAEAIQYSGHYGELDILIDDGMTASEFAEAMQTAVNSSDDLRKEGASISSSTTTTIGSGLLAYKVVMNLNKLEIPATITYYAIDHNGKLYLLSYLLFQANDTESNRSSFDKVVNTLAFTS